MRIVSTPDVCKGKPRIDGRRITVAALAIWHTRGLTPAEIVRLYPSLTVSEVEAALAYYDANREEIAPSLRDSQQVAEEISACILAHRAPIEACLATLTPAELRDRRERLPTQIRSSNVSTSGMHRKDRLRRQ